MHGRREQRRHQAEARHRIGRHRFELARHHRIGCPHERRDERRDQSGNLAGRETAPLLPANSNTVPASPSSAPMIWCGASRSPGNSGKHHDQQRPEIIQQPGFGRRREAQRQEIQRVISEQPADPDDPCQPAAAATRGPHPAARSRSGSPPARRSRTSSPPVERPEFSPSPPSTPPAATTSGSRSVRSASRCGRSSYRHSGARAKRASPE